ncbi:MAG: tetraacyldisaccharide 4'-kinase, partial [Candidatus Coatesbacteria bacterium]|nr:tetraacyldisaccharide 4'-kinase [Candidatus Coatesbacteria bacterium]
GNIVSIRNALYDRGVLKTYRAKCPIICVGNITTGGSGKTPAVIMLCELLRSMGKRVVIISRGYGRATRGLRILDPEAREGIDASKAHRTFGDEAILLANRLREVPIVLSEDRVEAAKAAFDKFRPDCLVMDDGFGHRRLARDLDILLFDARHPFANGRLLPCGMLREPLWAIARAEATIITRTECCSEDEILATENAVRERSDGIAVLHSTHTISSLSRLSDRQEFPPSMLKRRKVLAFCGIAKPESFFSTLSSLDAVVDGIRFADHHTYTASDLSDLLSRLASGGYDFLITTEKDATKLVGLRPEQAEKVFILSVSLSLDSVEAIEALKGILEHSLSSLSGH